MSMIAIPLARDISRLFTSIEVTGERDPSDHITMFYLGDDVPITTITKIIPIVHEVLKEQQPFLIGCRRITCFPKGDEGYPVIAKIESPALHDLREKIKNAFDNKKIKYSDKFPEWNPHVTLSYSPKKPQNITFQKTQWQVNDIALYGGNSHDERLFVSFPLSLKMVNKNANYIYEIARLFSFATEDKSRM